MPLPVGMDTIQLAEGPDRTKNGTSMTSLCQTNEPGIHPSPCVLPVFRPSDQASGLPESEPAASCEPVPSNKSHYHPISSGYVYIVTQIHRCARISCWFRFPRGPEYDMQTCALVCTWTRVYGECTRMYLYI